MTRGRCFGGVPFLLEVPGFANAVVAVENPSPHGKAWDTVLISRFRIRG